jgi:nitrite transporter NirC
MIDRGFGGEGCGRGRGKVSLVQEDPLRYMLRPVGAGMGLSPVVFVFWTLKQNLHETPAGAVIASGFFGVGLVIIVFTNTELFTSNNMYLTISSAEGRTSWKQAALLWTSCYFGNLFGAILLTALLIGAGSLDQLPPDHALFDGALCILEWSTLDQQRATLLSDRDVGLRTRGGQSVAGCATLSDCHAWADGKNLYQTSGSSEES